MKAKFQPLANNAVTEAYLLSESFITDILSDIPRLPSHDHDHHWVAVIVPNSPLYLKLTLCHMNQWFTVTEYREYGHNSGNSKLDAEIKVIGVAIAWMDTESLNQYWDSVLEYATNLQRRLNQPYIKVFRDGDLILVRSWQ